MLNHPLNSDKEREIELLRLQNQSALIGLLSVFLLIPLILILILFVVPFLNLLVK